MIDAQTACFTPTTEAELAAHVAQACADVRPLAFTGGGSKAALARTQTTSGTVTLAGMSGITLYEPAELVISARAGTPLKTMTDMLDVGGQMLPFEPGDWRGLLDTTDREPTIGGLVATNMSGPRRLTAGACRDSLIGLRFVNGRGEVIKSGGRVMKNVTGYDLARLVAGSWGTLGIITEATFKLLPKPQASGSLVLPGLSPGKAVALMAEALGSPFEIAAAAYLPPRAGERSRTVLRLENFSASIDYRSEKLISALMTFGKAERVDMPTSQALWRVIANLDDIAPAGALWRISLAPSKAPALLGTLGGELKLMDLGGGLLILDQPATMEAAEALLGQVRAVGGHAMLLRAPEVLRRQVNWFGPPQGGLKQLAERVRQTFDPAGILNPGFAGT